MFESRKPHHNRAEFLAELQRECALRFTPETAMSMMMEVEVHLDESIQARLELGEAPEVAEINAVAAFSTTEIFVQRMEEVHTHAPSHDKLLLGLGLTLVCLLTFWIEIASTGINNLVWIGILFGVAIAIFVRSCFLRTPKWGTIKTLLIASVVLMGGLQPLLTLHLTPYGGIGYISAFRVPEYIADCNVQLREAIATQNSPSNGVYRNRNWSQSQLRDWIRAAEQASQAPVLERYSSNREQTVELVATVTLWIFFSHLIPLAVRRLSQVLRRPTRGKTA